MSVEQVRASILNAREKATESIAALQQASMALEEAQQIFSQATVGSNHQEVSQVHGMFAEALQGIGNTRGLIQHGAASAESYAAKL